MDKKTLGLYIGSFDPLHVGHIHVRDKAAEILDKVKFLKIVNYNKTPSRFPVSNYIDIQYAQDPLDIVDKYSERYNVVLVRGIRNQKDFSFENNFFLQLKDARPDVKIMYILCDEEYRNVSSSWIRLLPDEMAQKYMV